MHPSKETTARIIKDAAIKLGFEACGIAEAKELTDEKPRFMKWLDSGYHATMAYMNRNIEKRLDPQKLNDWARSVIVCLYNYFPGNDISFKSSCKISKYAYGKDYHGVIKAKLRQLILDIEQQSGPVRARVFVDSAPVLERAWAQRAGLGWTGKNACLIHKKKGSFLFIGCIITDLEAEYDKPSAANYCGSCTRCMEACPTKAIVKPGLVDARRCISYLSIEHKGELPHDANTGLHGWIFGCDICQDVCPWNRFASPHKEPAFLPKDELLALTDEDWRKMNEETFEKLFKDTPLERTGLASLKRNLQ